MAAYVALVSLKSRLEDFLKYREVFMDPPFLEILDFVSKEVNSLEEFLNRNNSSSSRMRMSASLQGIREASYKFEEQIYYIDLKFKDELRPVESVPVDEFIMKLSAMEVEGLKKESLSLTEALKKVQKEYFNGGEGEGESVSMTSVMIRSSDQYIKLKQQILCRSPRYAGIAVVGMAGIGKTTLAKEIFEDPDILESFDCRVWVAVGRNGLLEQVQKAVIAQIRLKKAGQRCLIVLDDVWDEFVSHYYINLVESKYRYESRVLITTKMQRVVEDAGCSGFNMRLLNKEESWDLLRAKVFAEEPCHLELEKAGKKIADKCDGLPLTIITVAHLLSNAEITPQYWNEVATRKRHQLFIDAYDQISDILYESYQVLAGNLQLQQCFLCVGLFLQNYAIPRCKLFNLWIVEQFVESEYHATKCLQKLDSYSLVMVYQKATTTYLWSWTPQIKTCGLHSSWWHFSHREARKRHFFHVLDCYKDGLGDGLKCHNRLSFHNNVLFAIKDVYNSIEKNCAFTARSLLCFGPYHQYLVPLCFGLRRLENLDALNIRFYEFPLQVLELVELRYLALTCNSELPPSISKLHKLQFLIVHQHQNVKTREAQSYLPMEIWDMTQLELLQVMGSDLPDPTQEKHPNLTSPSIPWPSIRTLQSMSARNCTRGVFEGLCNLNKLGIRIELTPDGLEPLSFFDYISHLEELKTLKCVIANPELGSTVVPPPAISTFPLNLRKLTLSGLGYPWEEMSKIASLRYLEVLKLRCNAFRGPKWETEEQKFTTLEYLLIEDLDLEQIEAGEHSFENLQCLSIKHCYRLKKLHLDIYIKKIEVVDCNPLVEKPAKLVALRKEADFHIQSSWKSLKP